MECGAGGIIMNLSLIHIQLHKFLQNTFSCVIAEIVSVLFYYDFLFLPPALEFSVELGSLITAVISLLRYFERLGVRNSQTACVVYSITVQFPLQQL